MYARLCVFSKDQRWRKRMPQRAKQSLAMAVLKKAFLWRKELEALVTCACLSSSLHLNNFWLSVSLGIIPAFCGCPSLQRSWSFHHPAGYLQPSGLQFSSCGQQEDELPLHWSQHSKGKGGEKSDLGLVCCPFLLWLWAAAVNVSSPPGKMRTYSSGVTVVSLS